MAGVFTADLVLDASFALPFRQGEAQDQVPAPAAAIAAARADGDELLAVHHVHRRRREDPGAGVEPPEQLARLRVERHEVTGRVAAAANEHQAARGDDRARLSEAVECLLPYELSGRRIVRRE